MGLGLYLIADQLATKLVPAVRERMLRVRFLTAMTVGALVTEGLEPNPRHPETPPYLIWEWLVVEAIVRTFGEEPGLWGVPGSNVTQKAINGYGYVDHRSYLKTPRVFGFNGVYKRLAVHLGLVDIHLQFREPEGEELIMSWSKDLDLGRFNPSHAFCRKWRKAVEVGLEISPPRTKTNWKKEDWRELAAAFLPHTAGKHEKVFLRKTLHSSFERSLEAFPEIWKLVAGYGEVSETIDEMELHGKLRIAAPEYEGLLETINSYERFCRILTDAFDIFRNEATGRHAAGLSFLSLVEDDGFAQLAGKVHLAFQDAAIHLMELGLYSVIRFEDRFHRFSEPMPPVDFAAALCEHHEDIQKGKSREGKRPWFDRLGGDRIYLRQNYILKERPVLSETYVHNYRGKPIHRFYRDLS